MTPRTTNLAALAALLAAACSRDLAVPQRQTLAVAPAFAALAPREQQVFVPSGGAGGYRFAFATGGRLSGEDAVVDPAGTYRAGSRGSAQDVLELVDAAGAHLELRVSVGPPVAVSPSLAGTAPGGQVRFAASGGKRPYTFRFAAGSAPSGGTLAAIAEAPDAQDYRAGPTPDVVDVVEVVDGTGVAVATATVRVGNRLQAYPPAASVSPYEAVQLVGLGGAPGYAYGFAGGAAPSGGTIAPSGLYTAGPTGGTTDVVRVTDQNGQHVDVVVQVGSALSLAFSSTDLRPGVPVQLVASGGKPPYAFSFADRGNRSAGTVDALSGTYVPGPSAGAVDVLRVGDATPAPAATLSGVAVGALRIPSGASTYQCVSGDLNGDGSGDVVFLHSDGLLTVAEQIDAASPRVEDYFFTARDLFRFTPIMVGDYTLDGRDDLAFADRSGWWSLVADPSGSLAAGPRSNAGSGVGVHVFHAAGEDPGCGGACVRFFVFGDPTCAPANAVATHHWDLGANVQSFGDLCVSFPQTTGGTPLAATIADLDHDGQADLVWIPHANGAPSPGPLHVAFGGLSTIVGTGGPVLAFSSATSIPFPAGTTFPNDETGGAAKLLAVDGGLAVRLVDAAGQGGLAFVPAVASTTLRGSLAFSSNALVDPFAGESRQGVSGIASYRPAPGAPATYVAWNAVDGRVAGFDLSPALAPTLRGPVATLPYQVSCVAFPDVNGDGAPDLVAGSEFANTSDLLWGDGDGAFGRRARQRGLLFPAWGAALDADGRIDAVAYDGQGISVLFGAESSTAGRGQLAWGPRIAAAVPTGLAAGAFCATGAGAVVFRNISGAFFVACGHGDGTFDPPAAMTVVEAETSTAPFGEAPFLLPADLGGVPAGPGGTPAAADDQGPDLYAGTGDHFGHSTLHVVLRDRPGHAVHVTAPAVTGRDCTFVPLGSGRAAFAAFCSRTNPSDVVNQVAVLGTTLSLEVGVPTFAPWTAVANGTAGDPALTEDEVQLAYNLGPGGRTLAAVYGRVLAGPGQPAIAPQLLLAEVTVAPGGSASNVADWRVTWTGTGLQAHPFAALLGDVTGDAVADLVAGGPRDGLVVLKGLPGGGFAKVPQLPGRDALPLNGLPIGVGPLSAGSPGDVLLLTGVLESGRQPAVVPLYGDASGVLR